MVDKFDNCHGPKFGTSEPCARIRSRHFECNCAISRLRALLGGGRRSKS
jgi:hypothetical protein